MILSKMSLLNLQKHNMWAMARYQISGSAEDYKEWVAVWTEMKKKETNTLQNA